MLGRAACSVAVSLLWCWGGRAAADPAGPTLELDDLTTCEQFSRHARFNPYSVLNDVWVAFYYFAPVVDHRAYEFVALSSKRKQLLQTFLNDSIVGYPVNWTQPIFLMKELRFKTNTLIVQMSDRGQFNGYNIKKSKKLLLMRPYGIIFKQSVGGKYLTLMTCSEQMAYVMARPHDIPRKAKIQDEAAKVGFRGRGGLSYLYSGHKWMPIPEHDDSAFPPEVFYKRHRENIPTRSKDLRN